MKKCHLICNAHIDPIWQWEWEEGASAALSTFQSAANLMEKHRYIFNHNEVTLYQYTEEYAPALFQDIKEKAKDGSWHIMGGWYLQPDCLLPSGEGIVRQLQTGKIYFLENFGYWPKTAVNFDPFGHSRGLVQILKKCGQDSYMFMRPYPFQLKLPSEIFLWEGYDGSIIKAARTSSYNSNLGEAAKKIEWDIQERSPKEEVTFSCWGVGNHGGGPSDKDLYDIEKLQKERKDIEIVHSTPDSFFSEVEPKEIYDKSLISCMVGCYTSMTGMKQAYRTLERELFSTEKIASLASLEGKMKYPVEAFKEATEDMLNVEFHDILPGSMIQAGENNGRIYCDHALHILNKIRAKAFFSLLKGEEVAKEGTYPIFAYNPKTYESVQLLECDMSILRNDANAPDASRILIYDEEGNLLPSQNVKESSNLALDWRKKVVFKAKLKPLGLTRFTAITAPNKHKEYPLDQDITFDNGKKRVVISSKTGLIESYVLNGKEYANGPLFRPMCYEDYEDPWGMNFDHVGKDPHPFTFLKKPDGVFKGLHGLEVIEDGDIYLEAEAFFGDGNTRLRLGYRIEKEGPGIDIDVTLFPNEINKAYKLDIPLKGKGYIGEQIFGYEELFEDGRECVAHDFLALKEEDENYLEILTPDSFGSSYSEGTIHITLLRMATYCAHPISPDRPLVRPNIFIPKIDQGERRFRFRLVPSKEEELKRNADLFSERPFAWNIFPTKDTKEGKDIEIKTSNDAINVVTIKKGIEKEGTIIRLQNCSGKDSQTTLSIDKNEVSLSFKKFEVKTILYHDGKFIEYTEMFI